MSGYRYVVSFTRNLCIQFSTARRVVVRFTEGQPGFRFDFRNTTEVLEYNRPGLIMKMTKEEMTRDWCR